MSYQVLARKWRPRTFSQVVGQQHVVKSLTNALLNDRLHHAYLFTGTRGVGKTSLARILAKAINCETLQGFDPCDACAVCNAVDHGRFLDLIEVDAASRTRVEDTRELLDNVQYAPAQGRFKVYLIDEVHMLSAHSFNALLKTLEEPPAHVKFLLATTDPQKIPVTILSRCMQMNLQRLGIEQIQQQMEHILSEEKIPAVSSALHLLARAADGSMRDGLSLLDQAIVFGGGNEVSETEVRDMLGWAARQPVIALLEGLANADIASLLSTIDELNQVAVNFHNVLEQMIQCLHLIALVQFDERVNRDGMDEEIRKLAAKFSTEDVQLHYQMGLMGQRDLDLAPDSKAGMEMLLLRMLAFTPASLGPETAPAAANKPVQVVQKPKQTAKPIPTSAPKSHAIAQEKPAVVSGAIPTMPEMSAEQPPIPPEPFSISDAPVTEHLHIQEPAVAEQTKIKQPTPAKSESAMAVGDWGGLIEQIKLSGMSREFASHCTLESIDDKQCTLLLDPSHAHLQNKIVQTSLEKAIQKHRKTQLKLIVKLEKPEQETPATKRTRISDERQQAAQNAIENDANVIALQQQFDATIIPGSVQPIDETGGTE